MKSNKKYSNKGLLMLAAIIWLTASCATLGKKPAAGDEASGPAANSANTLQSVQTQSGDAGSDVVITTSAPATYTVYKLQDPTRIILDITDTSIGGDVAPSQPVNDGTISEIQVVGAGEEERQVTRIVITLERDVDYDVAKEDGTLKVKIASSSAAAESGIPVPPAEMPEPALIEIPAEEAETTMPETPAAEEATEAAAPSNLPEPASGPLPPAGKILDIVTVQEGDLLRVVVIGDGTVENIDAFTLQNPPRIVVDIRGVRSLYPQNRLDINSPGVKDIRIGKHTDKVRLVLDLGEAGALPFTTVRRGDQLVITVGEGAETATLPEPVAQPIEPGPGLEAAPAPIPVPETETAPAELAPAPGLEPAPVPFPMPEPDAAAAAPVEMPPPAVETPEYPIEPSPEFDASVPAAETGVPVDVLSVDFDYTDEKSKIRIETQPRAEYEIVTNNRDNLLSIRIKNASISSALERSLDTSEFNSPVRMVSSYQWTSGSEKDVYVTLSLLYFPKYLVVREGNAILMVIDNPAKGAGAAPALGAAEYAAGPGTGQEMTADNATGPGGAQYYGGVGGSVRRSFSGRVVYLDYQRINVVDALSLLAEVANLNLVISGDLKGTVSLKLEAVPWDQALDIILRTQRYGAVIRGNIMRVAPLSILEEEEKRFKERKKRSKIEAPLKMRIIYVSYADPDDVATQLKNVLTPGRGKVEVDTRTNSLIIWDVADNLGEVEAFIRRVDIETPQVLIEARIVEARANLRNELGVQWGANYHSGAAYGNPTGLNFPGTADVGLGIMNGVSGASNSAFGSPLGVGISLGSLTNAVDLDLLLRALELEEKAHVVSSPRVLTLENEEASIVQGQAIPFSTTSASGTQTEFIDAALKIAVTPHVTADRKIIMDVTASNNTVAEIPGAQGPGINKIEATSRILVKDGETAVIGGIFVAEDTRTTTRVPLLGKVPFIGWLFRSAVKVKNRRELLIFITPRIVSGGPEYLDRLRNPGATR